MKTFIKLAMSAAMLMTAICVSAQTKNSVWAVDFIKTNAGQQGNYLKFIDANWAKARKFMKEKGIVSSYQSLSIPVTESLQWDSLLITEYIDQSGYDKREAVFDEYRKANGLTRIDGKTSRDMSEIKFSRVFNQPVTTEILDIMLKTQNPDAETAAARIPLENYLKGHATGNPEFMRKAFYTEGKLIFMREGKYSTRTFEEYIGGMNGKAPADESQRKRWIESVEVTGNAAVGKIILDYPTVKFTDYMTMLKIDGEWKIVNKSFFAEQKTQPQK